MSSVDPTTSESPLPEATDEPGCATHLIIGTAGHIDHGKTSLVKALTGTDTDRLPEEKRRGVTIELGFANLEIGPFSFGMVDVPGHERFVRTMVAGAMGIDIALLVVAADDSVMPQTIEHVEILDLVGVSRCVVAITKCDMVDAELPELVAEEVAELLEGTSLAGSPMIPVSSTSGSGIDELRAALVTAAESIKQVDRSGPFRMAIDRVFVVQGRGTVVTGSVLQGRVSEGDELVLWPAGLSCRVRALQSHSQSQSNIEGGQRAAINLSGIDRQQVERGCELVTPGFVQPTHMLDVRLRCLPTARRGIKHRSRVRLAMGTREVLARVVTPTAQPIDPGGHSLAQLRLSEPITAIFGQRFILRDETASRTVGGGVVLRCSPKRRRIRGQAELDGLERLENGTAQDRIEETLRFNGFERLSALTISAESGVDATEVAPLIAQLSESRKLIAIDTGRGEPTEVTAGVVDALMDRAVRWLERFHTTRPDELGVVEDAFIGYLDRKSRKGLGRTVLERMRANKRVKLQSRFICHPQYAPQMSAQDERIMSAMLDEFQKAQFKPPSLKDLQAATQAKMQRIQRLAKIAVATEQLVEIDKGLYLHHAWAQLLRDKVASIIRGGQDASVSTIKQELGSSRKYVVPFLEHLDRTGFTRRDGDVRVLCEAQPS